MKMIVVVKLTVGGSQELKMKVKMEVKMKIKRLSASYL